MKKEKKRARDLAKLENTVKKDSVRKLTVGMEVLFMTKFTLDRTKVESVILKENIAVLANNIKVSRDIGPNGILCPKTVTLHESILRAWSPETEAEYNYELACRNIPIMAKTIADMAKEAGKEEVLHIYNRLKKLINKYE